MNKTEQRKLALGAVRSKLRQQGIDPLTVNADHALMVLDDLARVENTIATQWYLNASDNQVALFRREWRAWVTDQQNINNLLRGRDVPAWVNDEIEKEKE